MIKKMLGYAIALNCFAFMFTAQAVVIDGKDWRQLVTTSGLGYDQVSNISGGPCDVSTGLCNGVINTVDFTGWTWASLTEVDAMIKTVYSSQVAPSPSGCQDPDYIGCFEWADHFVDGDGPGADTGLFVSNGWGLSSIAGAVAGFTRDISTISDPTNYTVGFAAVEWNSDGRRDSWYVTTYLNQKAGGNIGIWLYKSLSVPEPTPLALMGLGLTALSFRRRKV